MAIGAQTKLDRIESAIVALSVVAGAGLIAWRGPAWGAGGFVGGVVSWLNFRWLRTTVEKIMGDAKGKARVAFVYAFKFTLLAAVLAGLILGLDLPALAVLIGVGAMPLGIVAETFWSTLAPLPAERAPLE